MFHMLAELVCENESDNMPATRVSSPLMSLVYLKAVL
jgi:hypothetical protein